MSFESTSLGGYLGSQVMDMFSLIKREFISGSAGSRYGIRQPLVDIWYAVFKDGACGVCLVILLSELDSAKM